MVEKGKKKVLLIKLSSLGDVIFNIPLANILKDNGYEVSWLVSEKGYDILKGNPCVDNVILAPFVKWKREYTFCQKMKEVAQIRKYLKGCNFDIAIDTQGLLKSMFFMIFMNIKRRLVNKSAREFSTLGGNEWVNVPANDDYNTHIIKKYLAYAKHLGLNTDEIKLTLPPSEQESVDKINELLKDTDKTKPLVVVCPATTWDNKHWDKDNWKSVINAIKDNYTIVFTGTKNDIDLIEYIGEGKFLNLAGKTNLKDLIELFRRSDLVLSLDSGSTHLAWATQVPKIVSIFCCTPPTLYGPIGEKYISLSGKLACQPCHLRKCKKNGDGYNACTKLPLPDSVLKAIEKLMDLRITEG